MPFCLSGELHQGQLGGIIHAVYSNSNTGIETMTKNTQAIQEAIHHPKHPFPKVDNRPKKSQKHRYERRKIREYLHLGVLLPEEST